MMAFSCKKTVSENLAGKWKMITVKDNGTNALITKPPSIQKDVIITFAPTSASTGIIWGNTPTNLIDQNPYSNAANGKISIPELAMMTKVAETSWGSEFVDNITEAEQYSFDKRGNLSIRTINKSLFFERQ